MKTLFMLISLLQFVNTNAQENSKTTPSTINQVVVFSQGAQVKRISNARVEQGKSEIIFSGISPNIDKQSLRVKGKGKFTILNVICQSNYFNTQKSRQEIKVLKNKKNQLSDNRIIKTNIQNVINNENAILNKNQTIGGTNIGLKTNDLKEAVDFHKSRLTENYKLLNDINKEIYTIDTTLTTIEKQLQALNNSDVTNTNDIIVSIKSIESIAKAEFEITYYVKDAGWYADYDLRVKDVVSPIQWTFKANVFQQSGEDWKNVKMSISNGNPTDNGIAPKIKPWFLGYVSNRMDNILQEKISGLQINNNQISGTIVDESGMPLPGAGIIIKGTNTGTETDYNGNFTINGVSPNSIVEVSYIGMKKLSLTAGQMNNNKIKLYDDDKVLEEVVVTGYNSNLKIRGQSSKNFKNPEEEKNIPIETKVVYQPTSIVYEIKEPMTVLNDNKNYKTEIKTFEVPAHFQYVAVPKLDKGVYLNAKVIDWQELNLFEGEINLFFEDEFHGKSFLNLTQAKDTLEISLGKDKSIVVERKPIKNYTSKQFLSSYKKDSKAFEIFIRNNKSVPINVLIYDQFPISTNKEIEVEDLEYLEATLEEYTKIITWNLNLSPKTEKKVALKYQIKYPKYKEVNLE